MANRVLKNISIDDRVAAKVNEAYPTIHYKMYLLMATWLRKICCFDSVRANICIRYFILLDLAIIHLLGKAPVYIRYASM